MLRAGICIAGLCLCIFCTGGEGSGDIVEEMKRMEAQIRNLSSKLEDQQKKIDEQDRTIVSLKGQGVAVLRDNPALDKLTAPSTPGTGDGDGSKSPYELPGVTVTAPIQRTISEIYDGNEKVGSYGQPRWTTQRRFSETRAYVIPAGTFEFEYWNIVEVPKNAGVTTSEQRFEAEIGLGNRLQFDL